MPRKSSRRVVKLPSQSEDLSPGAEVMASRTITIWELRAKLTQRQAALDAEAKRHSELRKVADEQETRRETAFNEVQAVKFEIRQARNQQLLDALAKNPELIDILAPEHTLKSCPREDTDHRCARCALETAVRYSHFTNDWSIQIEFD